MKLKLLIVGLVCIAMLMLPVSAVTYSDEYYKLTNQMDEYLQYITDAHFFSAYEVFSANELRRQTILMEKQNELLEEQNGLLRNMTFLKYRCEYPNDKDYMSDCKPVI